MLRRDGVVHYCLPPVHVVVLLLLRPIVGRFLLDGVDSGMSVPPKQEVEGNVEPAAELFLQRVFWCFIKEIPFLSRNKS